MSLRKKILDGLKDFGLYQVRIFILVSLFEISTAIAMVLPILTHARMNFRCSLLNHSQNTTDSSSSSMLDPVKEDAFPKNYTLEQTNLSFCDNCCNQRCSDITFSTEFTSIVSEWNLICDQEYVTSFINTMTMVGLLCGGFISGQLSDQFGRKKVLYGCFTLLLFFQLLSGFANSWQLYCVCRFIIGSLISSIMVANFVLPMEYVIPKWRTLIGCIGFWPVGIILVAFWGYFVRNWRYLTISTACAGFPMLATWWFVSESPRWLFTHGQEEAAKKIFQDIGKYNKTPATGLINMYHKIQEKQEKKTQHKKYTYWHLFSSLGMCKKTLVLNYGWFTCCSVYYGLMFSTKNLSGSRYINIFLSGVVELPALYLVLAVNNSFGRKKTIIMLIGIAGLSSFSILFLQVSGKYDFYPKVVLTLAMVAKSGVTGSWAALQVLSAELFPTVVRSIGVGSCSVTARIGAIIAIQVIKLAEISKQVPFVIFGMECLLFAGLLVCLPETAGVPLEDRLKSAKQEYPTSSLNGGTDVAETERMNQNKEEEEEEGKAETQIRCTDNVGTNRNECNVIYTGPPCQLGEPPRS